MSRRARRSDPKCRHVPKGRVAWPPGAAKDGEAHASTYCCDIPACVDDAAGWVHGVTGHRGEFVPFSPEAAARIATGRWQG